MFIKPTLKRHIEGVSKICLNDVISGILLASFSVPLLTTCCQAQETSPQQHFSNVAMHMPTFQISTLNKYTSGKSVDGNSGTHTDYGDCAVTLPERSPWWLVNLQDYFKIDQLIVVTNLSLNKDNNLLSFKIEVAMGTGPDLQLLQPYVCTQKKDFVLKEFAKHTCEEPLVGRIVKLTAVPRAGFFSLVLCEVKVLGRPLFQETRQGNNTESSNKVYNQSHHDMKELRRLNKIDKHKFKATRRKKVSATDSRASSAIVGTVAIIILSVTFGSIIISDCRTFYRCLRGVHRRAAKAKRAKNKYNMTAVENIFALTNQPSSSSSLPSELKSKKERCSKKNGCSNKRMPRSCRTPHRTNACQDHAEPHFEQSNVNKEVIRKRTNDTKIILGLGTWPFPTGMDTRYPKDSKTKICR